MSRLLKDSSWLGAALGVQILFSLVSQRILNQHLTPEERGMIAFSMLVIGATFDLLRLDTTRGVTYLVAVGRPFWPVVHADLLWTLAISALTLCMVPLLPMSYSLTGTEISLYIAFWAWVSQASRIFSTFSSALSGLGRYREVGISAALGALTLLVARAVLVPRLAAVGEFIASALGVIATSLPCLVIALRDLPMERPKYQTFRSLLDYGRRSMGSQTGNTVVTRGLPLVLFPILGPAAAGVYVATSVVPTLLATGVTLVTRPLFSRSSTMNDYEAKAMFAPACRVLTAVSALGALVLICGSDIFLRILGAEHFPHAQAAMIILTMQSPMRALAATIGAHLSGSGHPQDESRSLAFGAAGVLLAASSGALWFGLYGALAGEFIGLTLRLVLLSRSLLTLRALKLNEVSLIRRSDFLLLANRLWRVR